MAPKEFDIIYIFNHDSDTIEQCRVIATDFGGEGQCLVYGLTSKTHFVTGVTDMYKSPEECLHEEARKIDEGYMAHYEAIDSMEIVVLHAIYAAMTGTKLDNLEIQALIHRASEFMQVDVRSSLDKYVKAMEKENCKKSKKKEGIKVA